MTALEDWPVVITHGCAEAFGLGDREQARHWLEQLIIERGLITDQLPVSLAGRRSRLAVLPRSRLHVVVQLVGQVADDRTDDAEILVSKLFTVWITQQAVSRGNSSS